MSSILKRLIRLVGGAAVVLFSVAVQAGEVDCSARPPVFPTFDGTCRDGRDCRIGVHQVDCCGSRQALGINYLELERFDSAEALCETQFPACDCLDRGIMADDGNSTYDPNQLGVFCNAGTCFTFVNPAG